MASLLSHLDPAMLQQCMHCGMCLPVCPTYNSTHREKNSPRGRIALMRGVAEGQLVPDAAFADEMAYCLGCLACQTACPAGVEYVDLFESARATAEHHSKGGSLIRRIIRAVTLRFLFTNPRALRFAGSIVRWYRSSGLQAAIRRSGILRLLPNRLRELESKTPVIAPNIAADLIAETEHPDSPPKHRVLLLTGCVQDLIHGTIHRDTADVLLAAGCSVHTPRNQSCCGSLHAHNGDPATAQRLAIAMMHRHPAHSYDAIISNAGGCGSHLRRFSALFPDNSPWNALAKTWDSKIRDIHEWLCEIGWKPPTLTSNSGPATYHDSCHLCHGQKISSQPRELLKHSGTHLTPLPESSWCCGSAGIYNLTQPAQAQELLNKKIHHIRSTGAQTVYTANPGCHLQIEAGLTEAGMHAVTVQHPVSRLAEAVRAQRTTRPSLR